MTWTRATGAGQVVGHAYLPDDTKLDHFRDPKATYTTASGGGHVLQKFAPEVLSTSKAGATRDISGIGYFTNR